MGEKRRGAGEGSIFRRKDGRWVGQYEVEGKRRYVYGQDREGGRTRLTKALADRDAGLIFDSRNLTVSGYVPLWLDSIREAVGPRTWKRHEELIRLHIIPRLGSAKLGKLNALQIQSLYRKKLDAGLSPTHGQENPRHALQGAQAGRAVATRPAQHLRVRQSRTLVCHLSEQEENGTRDAPGFKKVMP